MEAITISQERPRFELPKLTKGEWYAFIAIGGVAFIAGAPLMNYFLGLVWPSFDWNGPVLFLSGFLFLPYLHVVRRGLGMERLSNVRFFLADLALAGVITLIDNWRLLAGG